MYVKYSFVCSTKRNARFLTAFANWCRLRYIGDREIFSSASASAGRDRKRRKTRDDGNKRPGRSRFEKLGMKEERPRWIERDSGGRICFRATWLHRDVTMEVIGILGMSRHRNNGVCVCRTLAPAAGNTSKHVVQYCVGFFLPQTA